MDGAADALGMEALTYRWGVCRSCKLFLHIISTIALHIHDWGIPLLLSAAVSTIVID